MISDIDIPDEPSVKKPRGWSDGHMIAATVAVVAAILLGGYTLLGSRALPSPHIEIASRWDMVTDRTKTGCPTVRGLKAALPHLRTIDAAARDAVAVHLTGRGC